MSTEKFAFSLTAAWALRLKVFALGTIAFNVLAAPLAAFRAFKLRAVLALVHIYK